MGRQPLDPDALDPVEGIGQVEDIYELADRFREQLDARVAKARREMVRSFAPARDRVEAEVRRLTAAIAARQAAGQPVPVSWLFERGRLSALTEMIDAEMKGWARKAVPAAREAVEEAATLGPRHAMAMVRQRAVPFPPRAANRLISFRPREVEQAVAHLVEGSPLRDLFDDLGTTTSRRARRAVVHAVTVGQGSARLGRELGRILDGNVSRGVTIARTETMRVYREATRLDYAARGQVIDGWEWFSTLDRRACPACVAMHGTEHPVTERLDGHPNCRCSMLPVLRPELRDPAERRRPTGEEAFASWPRARQLAVVGPTKLAMIERGEITLRDLVARPVARDPRWGTMRREATIGEALRNSAGISRAAARRRRERLVEVAPGVRIPASEAQALQARRAGAPAGRRGGPQEPVGAGQISSRMDASRIAPSEQEAAAAVREAGATLDGVLRMNRFVPPREWEGVAIEFDTGRLDPGTLAQVENTVGQTRSAVRMAAGVEMPRAERTVQAIHEIGHVIDFRLGTGRAALGRPAREHYLSEQGRDAGGAMRALMAEAVATPEYRALRELAEAGDGFAEYATTPREVWARLFSQWAAEESGDASLIAAARRMDGQWSEESWRRLHLLVDDVLRVRGLREAAA